MPGHYGEIISTQAGFTKYDLPQAAGIVFAFIIVMKFFKLILLSFIVMNLVMNTTVAQPKLTHVDLNKYAGKWYVIASIPTKFDKHWNYITESYHINENGTIEIYTTYKKEDTEIKSVFSKGFPIKESNNMSWKVQFIWPFKADYLIEEITDDYTYVVVGHPKKKFLYIMNRSGIMGDIQYHEILTRCEQKGYNLAQLHKVEQGFDHH